MNVIFHASDFMTESSDCLRNAMLEESIEPVFNARSKQRQASFCMPRDMQTDIRKYFDRHDDLHNWAKPEFAKILLQEAEGLKPLFGKPAEAGFYVFGNFP